MESEEKLKRGPVTLYEQMKTKILKLIDERQLKPHDLVPSEGELAELFGVSRRTSKQALEILANEGVVYRLPRRGTFLAESVGHVKIPLSKTIGFIVPEIDNYIGQVISTAIDVAKSLGFQVLIRVSDADQSKEASILRELVSDIQVDGVLLFPGDRVSCGNAILRLHLEHFPIVIVDRTFKEIDIPSVYHDHFQGAYDMTKYLITQNHTHIGFVSEPIIGVMSREERYYGYIQAHQDMGLAIHPKSRFMNFSLVDDTIKTRDLEQFIQDNPDMTAVFCSNDYVAMYVSYAAQNVGKAVPDELSMAGFTDLPICKWMKVPLTSVKKDTHELGCAAVSLLAKRIAQPQAEFGNQVLSTYIQKRASVRKRRPQTTSD